MKILAKSLLSLLLCAGLLLMAVSCGKGSSETESADSEQTDGEAVESADDTDTDASAVPSAEYVYTPSGDPMPIIAGGESDYQIIYPESVIPPTKTVYTALKAGIRVNVGLSLDITSDKTEFGEYEILIGKTNRPASAEAYGKLKENQFSFTLSDHSIVIAASDDACMKLAIDTFLERYAKEEGNLTVYTGDFPVTFACGDNYKTVTIDNTAGPGGSDPYVVKHDGYYYYCWSEGGVKVARVDNLNSITTRGGKLVFNQADGNFSNVWAPELHYIDGEWYIYVAMCKDSTDNSAHRMYCLKGTSQDPTDPFKLVGTVGDSSRLWAIDGTVFKYKGELYTIWSGWPSRTDGNQNLYIAHMSNPWTIDSNRVLISTPTSWDFVTKGPSVNEGPCVLVVGDTIHVLYSGNGSWTDDYCIGYLTFSGGDILDGASWKKSRSVLLSKSDKIYGPGHCSVVQADDGSYQMIYHANLQSGSGWNGRSIRVQEIIVTEEAVKLPNRRALTSDLKISEKYVIGPVTD